MTIDEVKNIFETTALNHVDIKSFGFGEDSEIGVQNATEFPNAFLEIPYNLSYDLSNYRYKTIQFAFLILLKSKSDDLTGDHYLISASEQIAEAILTKIMTENKHLVFETVNGLSVREFSDDSVAGFRFDLSIQIKKSYCLDIPSSYADQFKG